MPTGTNAFSERGNMIKAKYKTSYRKAKGQARANRATKRGVGNSKFRGFPKMRLRG